MKATSQGLLLTSFAVAVHITLGAFSKPYDSFGNFVPNQFLVEVDTLSHISNRSATRRVSIIISSSQFSDLRIDPAQSLDAIYSTFQERHIQFDVTREYDAANIFVGAAVVVKVRSRDQ